MNTTLKINEAEDFMSQEDMEKFVARSEFRATEWRYFQTTSGKFTFWTMDLRGPNWFAFLQIKTVGDQWKAQASSSYWVSVNVHQTDGSTLMQRNEHQEHICDIKEGTDPKSLMPLLDAAMDELAPRLAGFNIDGRSDLMAVVYKITFAVLPYLRGAGVMDETPVQEPDIEECELDPATMALMESGEEDMSQYAQVAVDAGLVGQWQNKHEGITNRFADVYFAEVTVPNAEITGYIDVFKGAEAHWLIHVCLADRSRWRKIIGYTHTRPTQQLLDKYRDATLIACRAASEAEFPPMSGILGLDIVEQVQKALMGNSEIYAINYPERTNESEDEDVDEFVTGFLRVDGIKPWKEYDRQQHMANRAKLKSHSADFNFKSLSGYVMFYEDGDDQVLSLNVFDHVTRFDLHRVFYSSVLNFFVPQEDFPKVINALVDFVADVIKPLTGAKGGAIPNFNSTITAAFANTVQPWMILKESMTPEELWGDVAANGGMPLEWKESPDRAGYFFLRITWLDGSHRGAIGLAPTPEIWPHGYMVKFQLWRKNQEDGDWDDIVDTNTLTYIPPKTFGQFQNRTIAFAKSLIAQFNAVNPALGDYCVRPYGGTNMRWEEERVGLMNRFKAAANFQKPVRESSPEDMFTDFDWAQAMRPWEFKDGRHKTGEWPFVRWDTYIGGVNSAGSDRTILGTDEAKISVIQFMDIPNKKLFGYTMVFMDAHSVDVGGTMYTMWCKNIQVTDTGTDDKKAERVRAVVDRVAKAVLLPVIPARKLDQSTVNQFRSQVVAGLKADGYVCENFRGEAPVLEAVGLTFRSECRGAHNGQSDMTLFAEQHGRTVGRIEYCLFNGEIHVQFITTAKHMRRKGVARSMAKQLQSEYPGVEIDWGMSTTSGTAFLDALKREFLENPDYSHLHAAYQQAKTEREVLQAEFDAWIAADKGKLPPEMLLKGERMNELETLIWDLEDQLRDLKPGRWLVRENEDPVEFMAGFEKSHQVGDWAGAYLDTSTGPGAYLHSNWSGVLGRFRFGLFMRPDNREDVNSDCSFSLASWAEDSRPVAVGSHTYTCECPDIWIRLSSTVGMPRWQPGNIQQFQADVKEAVGYAAEAAIPDASSVNELAQHMFVRIYAALKKKEWKMDVARHGNTWQLPESWSTDDMEQFVTKATTVTVDWAHAKHRSEAGYDSDDWIMRINTPQGQLMGDENNIKMRFFEPREDGVQEVSMALHLACPHWAKNGYGRDYVERYDHLDVTKCAVIRPEDGEDLRQAVEAVFQRTVGNAINTTPDPKLFRLSGVAQQTKVNFARLMRKFWVKGKTYGLLH